MNLSSDLVYVCYNLVIDSTAIMKDFRMSYAMNKKQIENKHPQTSIQFYAEKDALDIEYESNLNEFIEYREL